MNYHGDVTASIAEWIESGVPMGPNYLGEYMWPVSATYDADADRTHVEFDLRPPESRGTPDA